MLKKIIVLILMLVLNNTATYGYEEIENFTERAIVVEVSNENEKIYDNFITVQNVRLKILSGKYKGQYFDVKNNLTGNPAYDIEVDEGDKVIIGVNEKKDGSLDIYITEYTRDTYIYYLIILFSALLIIIGKYKGLKTIVTLIITIISIYKILLPLMLKGYNPIFITIITSFVIVITTITIITGLSKKSASAILGTLLGVIIAGTIAYLVGTKIKLTGLSSEEISMLAYVGVEFDFRGLLFSGILLGALGATMDVSMSIASSIEEIHNVNQRLKKRELFLCGMNVGKDIMGTMSNTLILAYTGSSIPLLILFMAYDTPFIKILNLDIVATEIVRALSGSIGLILAAPITALASALLAKKSK
ncbi:YibE/F family protein [Alkalithermobacter paradoxus]|uniref:YibE/F-like protein n=1 Tax=Alkalithermobacter paradoxus TaxID=29349 RepID=A0A1V4IAX3_9FIRM|nr:YibE/F-like protein [[Clostridium] thermoalcaliphilum]